MDGTFDVFVIGPMGDDKNDPNESSTPISQHMRNLESALKLAIPDVCPTHSRVSTPEGGGSAIVDHVFNLIDRADLAVADISSRSPSVMYELAFFHALGTPILIVDDEKNSIETTPFYLNGANIIRVDGFEVEELRSKLAPRLKMFFDPLDDQDFATNPITEFYAAPLVEVSGASAIARGYYLNMVNGFLNAVGGVISNFPNDEIKSLTVIRPSPSFQVNGDLSIFGGVARQWNGGREPKEKVWEIRSAERVRKFSAYFMDGHVYDYPRTLGTLNNSPRLLRLSNRGTSRAGGVVDESAMQRNRAKITKGLIDSFFTIINQEMRKNETNLLPNRFRVISLEEFRSELLD